MRAATWGLMIILLLVSIEHAWAQDSTSTSAIIADLFNNPDNPRVTFRAVSLATNTCPQDLFAANREAFPDKPSYADEWTKDLIMVSLFSREMVVPPHQDCYHVVTLHWQDIPSIEVEYNVCIEDFYHLNWETFHQNNRDDRLTFLIPKDAQPCVNQSGQRLAGWPFQATERQYSSVPFVTGPADIDSLGYCLKDLRMANPTLHIGPPPGDIPYIPGLRVFVPHGTRQCQSLTLEGKNLYEVSRDFNVCLDVLLEASFLAHPFNDLNQRVYVPLNAPPCYDADGYRLNHADRTTHIPEISESLLDIARQYDVCLDDLWEANALQIETIGPRASIPDVGIIFIPDTPPCKGPTTFTISQPFMGFDTVSSLTNVCIGRLREANPGVRYQGATNEKTIESGQTLIIPDRPDCYHRETGQMQQYVCYSVPVSPDADFTGHVPPITASRDTDLPYCYERVPDMTVVYNNQRFTLYQTRGYESDVVLSQCFGMDVGALEVPAGAWSYALNGYITPSIYIPQPHADCAFLGLNDEQHYQYYRELTYQAGSLQDGVYIVNRGDTLNSIGRKYGYLPQWIADANALESTYWIYYLQELKMPSFPSLYTLVPIGGAAGLIGLISTAIYALRHRRNRFIAKKKNESV